MEILSESFCMFDEKSCHEISLELLLLRLHFSRILVKDSTLISNDNKNFYNKSFIQEVVLVFTRLS